MRHVFVLLTAWALVSGPLSAADPAPFPLTVDSIMRGPKLVGYPPSSLRWSGDSQRLYFEWRERDADEPSTWVVGRSGGEPRKLSDEERKAAPPASGVWDGARRRAIAVQDGDIVLIDTVAATRTPMTRTVVAEANPRWGKDESHITFTRDNAIYMLPVDTAAGGSRGGLIQLTDAGPAKQDPKLTESQKFLKEEEQKLLEFVREAEARRAKNEGKRERDALPKLTLTEPQSALDLRLAHGDRYVYALVGERAPSAKRADVPNYVTLSGYMEPIPTRTKVGDAQETRRLAILDLETKQQVWAAIDLPEFQGTPAPTQTEPATGSARDIPKKSQSMAEPAAGSPVSPGALRAPRTSDEQPQATGSGRAPAQEGKTPQKSPGRELRWSMPILSENRQHAVAAVRSADNEDRWLVLIDPATGKSRVLDHLHDPAWVRELGGFGGDVTAGFLPDHRRFWFLSERDGWMHLYTVDVADPGAPPRQLTSGKWEITDAELSADRTVFLLTTTAEHPGERHVYTMPVDGGATTKLTSMTGASSAAPSPDGTMLGLIYSWSNRPPEVYLMPNRAGARAEQVTTSTTAEWRSYRWVEPQLVTFNARDGAEVYARLYTPEMVGASRHSLRPGVVFVHGAGYLQNAHRYWSTYYREYMFHHLLASRGYVVLDVDYRASAGYGRDWRAAIYRHMGGKDLEDVIDSARYLARAHQVDARRLGLYGGSYGGFITLMALFTSPDTFAAGAALRPVTDWAHYSHTYTANILNEPQADADAYRRSSPIYFAQNLKGALLICHGMVDTNVHFQDSVRLAQRLIELGKENWELAVYPVENHAFERASSWADEYKRVLKLFEDNLKSK
jgi:dipeptidyl aminopeptidase/acylaminoacyl peptidase